ncbi:MULTISPECIES: hypothetical protein [unclassified Rathayibacter]|uniref:hypothetical protein n=1 Tax=unclassified Rathayibacter TaxID=2609250 RepID=UPI000CE93564|nr:MULTISPECIES: hypothetical protein [unclassified Rathayibacter]PPH72075.1 hypothetical protein C5C90_14375 [Rathayibacter sp. AY1D4]PPH89732.1 hypothetical protein C5C64_09610 [Rathayibacter sp. AY1D3]
MNAGALATLALTASLTAVLCGCAEEKPDPLAATNSTSITDITDNTGTGYYTVDAATLSTTGLGTELELAFTILNSNGIKFNPVSTITFSDGSVLTCEADDLRRIPSLVESTDSWDFACDGSLPEDSGGARLVVVDTYND